MFASPAPQDMAPCHECGKGLEASDNFCARCGAHRPSVKVGRDTPNGLPIDQYLNVVSPRTEINGSTFKTNVGRAGRAAQKKADGSSMARGGGSTSARDKAEGGQGEDHLTVIRQGTLTKSGKTFGRLSRKEREFTLGRMGTGHVFLLVGREGAKPVTTPAQLRAAMHDEKHYTVVDLMGVGTQVTQQTAGGADGKDVVVSMGAGGREYVLTAANRGAASEWAVVMRTSINNAQQRIQGLPRGRGG